MTYIAGSISVYFEFQWYWKSIVIRIIFKYHQIQEFIQSIDAKINTRYVKRINMQLSNYIYSPKVKREAEYTVIQYDIRWGTFGRPMDN